ncbi:MAG: YfcE family phosphodiesterase [Gemmatimonadetes bacterium]|nr:YfcE family phosphodiesterase [Gemmatimonadota bacterium]
MRIGVVSDTHDRVLGALYEALEGVDEVLHAGDIASQDALVEIEAIAPVTAVYGNMDEAALRQRLPPELLVEREGVKIALVHGHRQGRARVDDFVEKYAVIRPDLVIFGHTHEPLSRVWDEVRYFNPGTAGGVGGDATCGLLTVVDGAFEVEHLYLTG